MASKRTRSGAGQKGEEGRRKPAGPEAQATLPSEAAPLTAPGPDIRWDQTNMRSSYANVCNLVTTREEFILMFGTNQAFDAEQNEVTVKLSARLVLNPQAAKRIARVLGGVMREYEARVGEIKA